MTVTNYSSTFAGIPHIRTTGYFSQVNNCGGGLAAGASCTIKVTFTSPGTVVTGVLDVTDASGTVQYVSLTGQSGG